MNDAVIPHRSGYKGILFFWILLVYMDFFLYLCNMKSVGIEFEDKLSKLADTNIWLWERGESEVYQFKVPAAVQKYFMRGVDDQWHNLVYKVRPQLRAELVYTNVYWGK